MADPGRGLAARRRQDNAHRLWHRALDAYLDVDEFVININALIQALRTITWLIQKELRDYGGFEDWYAPWQVRMRADPIMRWLVEARNTIEKEGDLEIRSIARVRILASWLAGPIFEAEMPPLIDSHEIAALISQRKLVDRVRKEGVITVERRWVSIGLPDHELLDACAHGFAVLNALVAEAESRFQGAPAPPEFDRLECMIAGPEARSALLHLESGDFVQVARDPHEPSLDDYARVEKRYGDMIRAVPKPQDSLGGRVSWQHQVGRGMLLIDKGHRTIAFLLRGGHVIRMVGLDAEDQAAKYLLMESLARDAAALGADEVMIITGEFWTALAVELPHHPDAKLRPGERADKGEALVTYGLSRDGSATVLSSDITRLGGDLRLGEVQEVEAAYIQALLPVWRAWHGEDAPPPW